MAVGFDRPIVALFGPTRVNLVGPFRRSNDVLQHIEPGDTMDHKNAAAGRLLMERIGIDEVLAAASSRLGGALSSWASGRGTARSRSSGNSRRSSADRPV